MGVSSGWVGTQCEGWNPPCLRHNKWAYVSCTTNVSVGDIHMKSGELSMTPDQM